MHESNKPTEKSKLEESKTEESASGGHNVAIPVDLQIQMAKTRLTLAKVRYSLSVSRGKSWGVSPSTSTGVQS